MSAFTNLLATTTLNITSKDAGKTGVETFFNSTFGNTLLTAAGFLAAIVAIYLIWTSVKHFAAGQGGKGAKTIFLSIVFFVLAVRPYLPIELALKFAELLSDFITSLGNVISQ